MPSTRTSGPISTSRAASASECAAQRATEAGPAAGEIAAEAGELVLGTASGGLALEAVQPPGKRAMSAADFLRGHDPPARAV